MPPTWEEKDNNQHLNTITTPEEEDATSNIKDSILWVNHLYPIKVSRLDFRSLLFHIPITKKLNSLFPEDIKILSIEKRIKEGGAYIHFQYDSSKPEYNTPELVMEKLKKIFAMEKKHFHFASRPAQCKLVYGRPFVEDIDYRFPSTTLKITFKGSEMSIDDMFRLFRPYGHIRDIHFTSPVPSKDGPRQAIIVFKRMEGAIATRNCLHNKYFPEFNTTLYMDYEQQMRINKLKDQFSKHPKIMIPLAGILATLLTILLFNPLREFFMERRMDEVFYFDHIDEEWQDRIEQKVLDTHFNYPPNSIVMISAPKGSGKSSLIDKVLEGRHNTLLVDCNQEVNNTDEEFIESFSKDIGFFPSYSLYSSFGSLMDAIIPTGKGAFHSTTNYQMQTILKLLDEVLIKKSKHFPDDPHQPYEYPLIVIDGFFGMIAAMESKEKANIIMDSIIQWAITSTQRGHAHVVFLSSDSFAGDVIKKYLDNRGGGQISTVQLGDVNPNMAINYIKKRIGSTPITEDEMKVVVDTLGGRYYDLNVLSQRMIAGDTVPRALSNMIAKAVSEIRAEGFGLSKRAEEKSAGGTKGDKLKWTRPQLWETIKKIAESNYVSYDDLLFNVFLGDESSLNNLIMSGILRFQSIDNERKVTAYSPLYCAAFKQMVNDLEFNVGMDILVQKARIEEELSKLSKVEDELIKLKNLTSQTWFEPTSVKKRRELLEDKLKDHVTKIETRENILKRHSQFQKLLHQQK
ncbi:hypothetical protein DICPUDRAFT_47921 [Dictyostelium purpureum]|uniref:Mitochondrial escape protein 2 C-terminal domain-containing protein n=1 Tax=Dictyostelium purpureum TaxID=5786 RepID=F0ZLZ2_DICPU|nr:uncharacterized protein DICPUDRAFT_47921 [Dictyostelium purpureum]EGC35068.1 hypothetical protein DICPUDRAFT_47921 [Dictyostelium purpureum]|eukprot:XP_003288436.1 hypothetical protein DICPUDRAFT_47921 [Dictyostelium purpureum]